MRQRACSALDVGRLCTVGVHETRVSQSWRCHMITGWHDPNCFLPVGLEVSHENSCAARKPCLLYPARSTPSLSSVKFAPILPSIARGTSILLKTGVAEHEAMPAVVLNSSGRSLRPCPSPL